MSQQRFSRLLMHLVRKIVRQKFTSEEIELLQKALLQPEVEEHLVDTNRVGKEGSEKWKDGTLKLATAAMQRWVEIQLGIFRSDDESESLWEERTYLRAACEDCDTFAAEPGESQETYIARYRNKTAKACIRPAFVRNRLNDAFCISHSASTHG